MDTFSSRGGRQQTPQRETDARSDTNDVYEPIHRTASIGATMKTRRMSRRILWTVIAGIAVAGLLFGAFVLFRGSSNGLGDVKSGQYQAVFLSNGQVYFGKLQSGAGDTYNLTKVFYLQAAQTDTANPQKTDTTASNMELVKLGNEVHGPEDSMIIARGQVLFYENLKADGKVAKTMQEYLDKNK